MRRNYPEHGYTDKEIKHIKEIKKKKLQNVEERTGRSTSIDQELWEGRSG